MGKVEINQQLEELTTNEYITKADAQKVEQLSISFADLRKESEEKQLREFINGGGDSVEFVYQPDEEDLKFSNLSTTLHQRIDKQTEAEKSTKLENLTTRKKIIAELKSIVKTDVKNLGDNFRKANELQNQWKQLESFQTEEFHDLESEYKILLDTFYYDAKIVKDAIELDYNKNLEAKKRVVKKIKDLISETDVRILEQKIRQYEKEWFRVGPVKRELRDEAKAELEEAIQSLQGRLDELYENQKELLEENLGLKIKLCERLNEILGKEYQTPKQYQQAAEKVITLQTEWKEIGRSSENDRIWEVFRSACDSFFDSKRDFFKRLASNRKENKKQKLELIKKADEVKNSTDWKKTSNYLIGLQKDWKKIGPAHPSEDQKLWERFRSSCDVFFNARSEHFKERDKEFAENLTKKQALIEQVKAFNPAKNLHDSMKKLQAFENEYQAIGFVPFKMKDKIHKAFYNALNAHYNALKIDRKEKEKIRYEHKVKSMVAGRKPDKSLNYERNKIVQQISELKTKLAQYHNNVSFTSNSKSNPLAQMIQKNMRDTEREIESLRMQLTLIKDAKLGKFNTEEE